MPLTLLMNANDTYDRGDVMEIIQRLRDVLVSSSNLLTEFITISTQELESAIQWDSEAVEEFTKRKETLIANEAVLGKSKTAIMTRVCRELGSSEMTLPQVIEALKDMPDTSIATELELLQKTIEEQVLALKGLTAQLQSVYNTNKRLCEGFFQSVGIANSGVYANSPWKPTSGGSDISTISFKG